MVPQRFSVWSIALLLLLAFAGDEFSPSVTIANYYWRNGNYIASPVDDISAGGVLFVEGERIVPASGAPCAKVFRTVQMQGAMPAETRLVWKRGRRWPAWQVQVGSGEDPKGQAGTQISLPVSGHITLASPARPANLPDRVTVTITARGQRTALDPLSLGDLTDAGSGCARALKDQRSFLVVETLRAHIRLSFAQELNGARQPLDWIPGEPWQKLEPGLYEREVSLLVARRPRLKFKGDRLVSFGLGPYLECPRN